MYVHVKYIIIGIISCIIISIICKWTIKEFIADIKPVFFYFIMLFFASIISAGSIDKNLFYYIFRLLFVIELSAIMFRTTTSIEIKNAVCGIKPLAGFGIIISISFNFIPELFILWQNINRAWIARGGKSGIKKIRILLFVLLTISFYKASQKAAAMSSRDVLKTVQKY